MVSSLMFVPIQQMKSYNPSQFIIVAANNPSNIRFPIEPLRCFNAFQSNSVHYARD